MTSFPNGTDIVEPASDTEQPPGKNGTAHTLAAKQDSIFAAVEVDIDARLGNVSLPVSELLALSRDSVLTLDRTITDPVDLRVNGAVVARGEIVTVDDNFAVRITEIVDPA
ncbi:MAG: FliM/FliN family flagellar motor switch protein [Pseudomonadota bacterium]